MNVIRDLFKKFLSDWVDSTSEKFTDHPTAILFRTELKHFIENTAHKYNNGYLVKASVGAGNWANVPWISILDPRITDTTQSGLYPVYLFCADGSGFYLSLNQGTTTPTKELGKSEAQKQASTLKSRLLEHIPALSTWGNDAIDLRASTTLGKSYEPTNIAAKYYPVSAIPSDAELSADLEELFKIYDECIELVSHDDNIPLPSTTRTKQSLTELYKPFLLLAGISGTGKTRFIKQQAEGNGGKESYCLVPVRPDWHEPSDLLGYISRLSGQAEYVPTPVLTFIVQAWLHIIETIHLCEFDGKTHLDWEGKHLADIAPFWLCLDEMNLAPVEQYFADYLSVLETRRWYTPHELATYNQDEGVDYEYVYECEPLLKAEVLQQLGREALKKLAKQLGLTLSNPLHRQIWAYFCQSGIAIPFNLMVAGTVNMDETTHGFSRKVIDRALTFDFNAFFPNDFDAFFTPALQPELLSYPVWSDGRAIAGVPELAPFSKRSVAFLKAVNEVLQKSPFELAYRALNELMLALLAHRPADDEQLIAIWDDFMMCKVLPRIEGDNDKLRCHHPAANANRQDNLLTALEEVLKVQFGAYWNGKRPDLFNRQIAATAAGTDVHQVPCRSQQKLAWMKERLDQQCFTSYWP